jgi:tetratricopeptide (TPR) repeat protein
MVDDSGGAGHVVASRSEAAHLQAYARLAASGDLRAAHSALLESLDGDPEAAWLACARALVLRADVEGARQVLAHALERFPASVDLRHALAGVLWQAHRPLEAEPLLRELLTVHPDHAAAAFLLARMLKEQGRMRAVESSVRSLFEHARPGTGVLIQAIELLDDCGRKQAAAQLVERAIGAGADDPRLHAYAGMLDMQAGDFALARQRALYALEHDARALDWQCANVVAACQRYASVDDADFARLRAWLQRPGSSGRARASVLFALGKAHDDVGDPAMAAAYLREANALADAGVDWSRKNWRRIVSARLDARLLPQRSAVDDDFRPLFVVGLPRSGSTLIADRLARRAQVCNRGELGWLAVLAADIARAGAVDPQALDKAAATYRKQVCQDDTAARWFIDKQPLNFLHVDLIAALFPNARIVWCMRNTRDTVLSIWMQYFAGPEQDFAYDFANIAAVVQGCERLQDAAMRKHPALVRSVRYEQLTQDADACIAELAAWIGLPAGDATEPREERRVISTSSAWQARQPVYTRSVGRWHAYAPHVPELLQFADD